MRQFTSLDRSLYSAVPFMIGCGGVGIVEASTMLLLIEALRPHF